MFDLNKTFRIQILSRHTNNSNKPSFATNSPQHNNKSPMIQHKARALPVSVILAVLVACLASSNSQSALTLTEAARSNRLSPWQATNSSQIRPNSRSLRSLDANPIEQEPFTSQLQVSDEALSAPEVAPVAAEARQAPSASRRHDGRSQRATATSGRKPSAQVRKPRQGGQAPSSPEPQKCALILQRTYVRKPDPSTDGSSASENSLVNSRVERICVKFEHVNAAIAEAKRRRGYKGFPADHVQSIEPPVPDVAELGELNQQVTRVLTKQFDLSNDEIAKGLPLIDMSRSQLWQDCPLMVKQVQCDPLGRFRSFTGHCNNLDNPTWGAAQTPFVRYLEAAHPDGIQAERASVVDGAPLPSPRLVTSVIHRDLDSPSGDLSLLIMVWGQIIDHDVALAAPPRDERGLDFNCCRRQHPNCKPIRIPDDDPLYGKYKIRCMDFKRSLAGLRPNCALGPRVHINAITSTIDANTIYGSTKAVADSLRTFQGGQLKVQRAFPNENLKPLLPPQLDRPDLDCFERPSNLHCFLAGDERVNEQPTLTVLHTLYVRDHNRIAEQLAKINPHWSDDRIYHETRHLEGAIVQHLLMNEYLPLLIGHQMMADYNLTGSGAGNYWHGYEPSVNPAISHGFSTAAFRQGHTFIQAKVHMFAPQSHQHLGYEMLRNLFKRPFHYYEPHRLDQVLAGIVNTPAQTYDPFITSEISGHLFQEPGEVVGLDLPAINLARGREQGTPSYNEWRRWCGLKPMQSFADLEPHMANRSAYWYSRLYAHVDDIDLWSGGVSERPMVGAQVGATFACIIARQFANIKRGDRFWFETPNQPSSFTPNQLRQIRRTSQARLLCYNSDNLQTIQRNVLKMPHPIYNPRVSCQDIPDVDLSFWRESPSQPGVFMNG